MKNQRITVHIAGRGLVRLATADSRFAVPCPSDRNSLRPDHIQVPVSIKRISYC